MHVRYNLTGKYWESSNDMVSFSPLQEHFMGGTVGVNTTTPNVAYQVDVNGALNVLQLYINGVLFTGGGGGGIPAATFITQTPDGTLTNEQALSLLGTGILKSTTGTGVISIATAADLSPLVGWVDDGTIVRLGTASDQVVIGIASPAENRLKIYQNNALTGYQGGLTLEQAGAGDVGLTLLNSGSSRWQVGVKQSDAFKFYINFDLGGLFSANGIVITTGGLVGVGTTAPSSRLHTHSTVADSQFYISSVAPRLMFGDHAVESSATKRARIAMATGAGNYIAGTIAGDLVIFSEHAAGSGYAGTQGNIYLATSGGNSSALFPHLKMQGGGVTGGQVIVGSTVGITAEGRVHILEPFPVGVGARATHIRLGVDSDVNIRGMIGLVKDSAGAEHYLLIQTLNEAVAWNNVIIARDGAAKLGVGTSSPNLKLDVRGTDGSPASSGTVQTGIARFSIDTSGSIYALDFGWDSVGIFGAWIQSAWGNSLGTAYPLRLNPKGGNVGVGALTTSPNTALEVQSKSRIRNIDNSTYFEIDGSTSGFTSIRASHIGQIYIDATTGNASFSPGQIICNRGLIVSVSPPSTATGFSEGVASFFDSTGICQTNGVFSTGHWIVNVGPALAGAGVTQSTAVGMEIDVMELRPTGAGVNKSDTYSELQPWNRKTIVGLALVPESELNMFGSLRQGYDGGVALWISRSAGVNDIGSGRTFPNARWHNPIFIDQNATSPVGTAITIRGGARGALILTGSIDPTASASVVGVGTLFTTQLIVGDRILVTGETRTVIAIASNTALTVDTPFSNNANDVSVDRLSDAPQYILKAPADQWVNGIDLSLPTFTGVPFRVLNTMIMNTSQLGVNCQPNSGVFLDVSGALAARVLALALVNGANNDLGTNFTFHRITGPTAAFSITGMVGVDGKMVTLYNATAQAMTIAHESASSVAANRISCHTGASIVAKRVTMIYSAADLRWLTLTAV